MKTYLLGLITGILWGISITIATIYLTGCDTNISLSPVCPSSCFGFGYETWKVDPSTQDVGLCRAGKPICDEKFNIIECQGQILPSPEICDGLDNDCDGSPDSSWGHPIRYSYHISNICPISGICRGNIPTCANGQWTCSIKPQLEVCNGLDDDCDNLIDEDLGNISLCFDDEFWKATQGICRAGVTRCISGQLRCDGQILPRSETCNETDDDCNGIVDDTASTLQKDYDIVFAIDTSGSMCGEINAVAEALTLYVNQFRDNPHFRWAIVSMTTYGPTHIGVIADFADITSIQTRLSSMGCDDVGTEASLDVLYQLCLRQESQLNLSWRGSAEALVFAFTDENAQSYTQPATSSLDIISMCLQHGVTPFQWAQTEEIFKAIVEVLGGQFFVLTDNASTMLEDLNGIIVQICQLPTQ